MTRRLTAALLLLAAPAAWADDWPRFRGPNGQGVSAETGLPLRWGPAENVAWKVPVPGDGWSSPVVAGDRVYLTAAADGGQSCRVLAYARRTGEQLWDVEVFRQRVLRKEQKNSYATPTPVTDGERVYAVFNDGGLAAVTADGRVAWVNRDVTFYSQHGLGASPILYRGLLIMPFDGSSEGPDKTVGWQKPWEKSFVLALDAATGRERWRARRGPSRIAHVTPVVVGRGGRDELVSPAGDVVQGFDPETGERLWSVPSAGEGVVPSPVLAAGLVVTGSGFGSPALRAVRLDGTPAVAWEVKRSVPMIPSPVCVGPHLFAVTEKGFAACYEAATGKLLWEERLGGGFSASPVAAGGRVYFLADNGKTTVVEAGPKFVKLAVNPLNEPCRASMAVAGGCLFVRTKGHLVCIGPAKP